MDVNDYFIDHRDIFMNEMRSRIALDATARTIDTDGRLHISKSHISKACVNPYYGREIPNHEGLGLDGDRIYYLFRDPLELAKGAPTFARLPILSQHIPISADSHPHELVVGAIGSDVEFNDPYLDADTCYWDKESIGGIETGTIRQHSIAYRYVPVMTPGSYQGESYDGVMTEIVGNHLALVEAGRAGSDVLAADSKLEKTKMTRLGKALFASLGAISIKLAQDSSLSTLVGDADKKTFNKGDVVAKLVAIDSDLTPAKLTPVMDAIMDNDDKPEPAKPAADEDETEEEKERKKKEADKAAMDSFKQELRDAHDARIAVRGIVGDVIAQDSAESIYGFALDEMKVNRVGVTELSGLKALFNLAQTARASAPAPLPAMDASTVQTQFPNAMRIRQA